MGTRSTEEIYHILENLNELETYYLEENSDPASYNDINTYLDFLNNFFIRENNLASMYFMQVPGDVHAFWKTLDHLDEAYIIFSGLDISIYKQFNFPNTMVHSEATFECIFALKGTGKFHLSEEVFTLSEGDCMFHPPGEKYLTEAAPDSLFISINLRPSYLYRNYQTLFSGCPAALNFFAQCYRKELPHNYLLFRTDNSLIFREILCQMFSETQTSLSYRNDILKSYFSLFVSYLKRSSGNNIKSVKKTSAKEIYYNNILHYLSENYRTADLDSVSDYFHLSKNYITRIMKQLTGQTFVETLTAIRIREVKEYLSETSLLLDDIAELVGFSDASYLWRIFKKHTGMSPTEYKEKKE